MGTRARAVHASVMRAGVQLLRLCGRELLRARDILHRGPPQRPPYRTCNAVPPCFLSQVLEFPVRYGSLSFTTTFFLFIVASNCIVPGNPTAGAGLQQEWQTLLKHVGLTNSPRNCG
jgi:hypothetical protein